MNKEIKKIKRNFSGINVNGYNIKISENYKIVGFEDREVYESILFCKTQFQNVIGKIKEDDIKIISLIGNNGIIEEKEYKNC